MPQQGIYVPVYLLNNLESGLESAKKSINSFYLDIYSGFKTLVSKSQQEIIKDISEEVLEFLAKLKKAGVSEELIAKYKRQFDEVSRTSKETQDNLGMFIKSASNLASLVASFVGVFTTKGMWFKVATAGALGTSFGVGYWLKDLFQYLSDQWENSLKDRSVESSLKDFLAKKNRIQELSDDEIINLIIEMFAEQKMMAQRLADYKSKLERTPIYSSSRTEPRHQTGIYNELQNRITTINEKFLELRTLMQNAQSVLFERLKKDSAEFSKGVGISLNRGIGPHFEYVAEQVDELTAGIKKVTDTAQDWANLDIKKPEIEFDFGIPENALEEHKKKLKKAFAEEMVGFVKTFDTQLKKVFGDDATTVINGFVDLFNTAGGDIKEMFTGHWDDVVALSLDALNHAMGVTTGGSNQALQVVSGAFGHFQKLLEDSGDSLTTMWENRWENVVDIGLNALAADAEPVSDFTPQTSNFSLPAWYNSREVMPLAARTSQTNSQRERI